MRRSRLVVGVTVVALLAAVVAVRGGTAADDADLAVGLDEPLPQPSPGRSQDDGQGTVLLAADGLPGLRLGRAAVDDDGGAAETVAGCRLVRSDLGDSSGTDVSVDQAVWETAAWVVEEEVVSVFVGAWGDSSSPSALLDTFLGPTIGSPVQAAQELDGATTVTERPFGADGPVVTVITVAGRGVETVYSDLPPYGARDTSEQAEGRISTVEVRLPAGRPCTLADTDLPPADLPPEGAPGAAADAAVGDGPAGDGPVVDGPVMDLDGTGPFRLGTPVADLAGVVGVVDDGAGERLAAGDGRVVTCQSFFLRDGAGSPGVVRATALDGVLTEVRAYGPGLSTTFGLPSGADADDVHALCPETAGRADPVTGAGVIVVDVDGTTVELQMQPARVWLPDLERPVEGGVSTVDGVVVRTPGTLQNIC